MAHLTPTEKLRFEKLFGMGTGYVLHFTNQSFDEFFRNTVGVNIYNRKYEYYGTSKAKRLRAFWEQEDDKVVGKLLLEMLDYWKVQKSLGEVAKLKSEDSLHQECVDIALILMGKKTGQKREETSEEQFLRQELPSIEIHTLGLDGAVTKILQQRIDELAVCVSSGASLSVIFLAGSTLEGILLGVAAMNPKRFNQAGAAPTDEHGKVRPFPRWTLANFIDVAHQLGLLGLDVMKFSHALRDFRNFIHPFQQLASRFNPDEHTARICWQVLRAAIADLSKRPQ